MKSFYSRQSSSLKYGWAAFFAVIGSFGGCKSLEYEKQNELMAGAETKLPIASFSERDRRLYESRSKEYMVVTQGDATTRAAIAMFKKGGNAIDAAVAASFAISVERPQSTGIAGGGFMLLRFARENKILAVDFREMAPAKAYEKMFLDATGNVIEGASTVGGKASGVPGMVAGVLAVHQKFGKIRDLAVLLQPAIELAENGFEVYQHLEAAILDQQATLLKSPEAREIFFRAGKPLKIGDRLVQKNLAKTLRKIAKDGANGFYKGEIARFIVEEQERNGGLISEEDLSRYEVKFRAPVMTDYKNKLYQVYSMPPPSSGGTHVLEMLNILEYADLNSPYDDMSIHQTASAMQIAYRDRANFLGDPDFVKIPLDGLLSKSYAKAWYEKIEEKALHLAQTGDPKPPESQETTHFTIADNEGNVVASTQTINGWFGSGVVVRNGGFVMNNQMDDFSAKPGVPNKFGVIGGAANAIAAKKRPLSSMSPTLVMSGSKPVLALGSPAGSQIINCVLLTTVNYLHYKLPLWESVTAVRYHHQWRPDKLVVERPGFSKEQMESLQKKGHPVEVGDIGCKIQAIAYDEKGLNGVSDPRGEGLAAGEGPIPASTNKQKPSSGGVSRD